MQKCYDAGMEELLNIDGRKLTPEEQQQNRKSIVRMLSKGHKPDKIADALGVSRSLVYATKKRYGEGGMAAIKIQQRGRREGEKRILTPEQEKEIRQTIIDKNPEQLKLKCCLWTRRAIREYIRRDYKVDLPLSTLGYYLERWGFSVQRPVKKAMNQDPAKIGKWLDEEYPAIEKQAREGDCEIYWGDETAVQNTSNYAKGYAPVGQTPTIEVQARKMKLNMLSAVSNRGKLRFTIIDKSVDAAILIDFMKRLVKDSDRKVLLILDNLRVHHAKTVTAWLANHKDEIEVFYLPPYAPEYNPDEYLNSDLKRSMGNRPMPKTEKDLSKGARSFLKKRQLEPEKVKAYFSTKHTKYAMGKSNV
jgi:transposase